MQYKTFGKTGVELPVIGQGTWNMPERGAGVKAAQRAIRRGIELGMVHLDTAEMYGAGRVEQLLGEAIRGIPRERLFIVTKVLPSNASYRGTIAAADRSLARLGCEYVDLYLLHWPGSHPLEATMQALEALVEQGKTRFIGVSNFETGEMIEAASHLQKVPLACNQVLYHLCERGIERALIPTAQREGIAVVAYTPFGRGSYLRSVPGRQACESVAKKHGATLQQVALAFLTREPGLFAIPKAARVEHVEENAAAGELELDAADVAQIDAAYPRGGPRALATL
jgi:diketogulonate reductase-like aldo/keto reductase